MVTGWLEETDSAQLRGTYSEVGLVKESALQILTRAEAEGRGDQLFRFSDVKTVPLQ